MVFIETYLLESNTLRISKWSEIRFDNHSQCSTQFSKAHNFSYRILNDAELANTQQKKQQIDSLKTPVYINFSHLSNFVMTFFSFCLRCCHFWAFVREHNSFVRNVVWLSPTHQPLLKWICFSFVFQVNVSTRFGVRKAALNIIDCLCWTSNSIKSISTEHAKYFKRKYLTIASSAAFRKYSY